MYGMVNNAIEELVRANHGDATWETIKSRAGVEEDVFISNNGYPDEMTYKLVAATCEVTGASARDVLFAFGEHWALNTARRGYPDLMAGGGPTLKDFLVNLPSFHRRVVMILPNLQPPRFEVSDVGENSLHLHYRTHRPGLSAFVEGLLSGLGKMFSTPVLTSQIAFKDKGEDHDIFLVNWSVAAAA